MRTRRPLPTPPPEPIELIYPALKLGVSVLEAAARLGIGRSLFLNLVKEGKIRPIKAGRRTIFAVTELQRYLEDELRAS